MYKLFDRSPAIARLLEFAATAMTRQRGLPVLIGIGFVVVSFVVQAVNVFARNQVLELVGVVVLHLGILFALIGLLMAEALG